MEKRSFVINETSPGPSHKIIWLLPRPTFLSFLVMLDRWYFTLQYGNYLENRDIEFLLDDDVGNKLIHFTLPHDQSTHNLLTCYNICRALLQDPTRLNDDYYWRVLNRRLGPLSKRRIHKIYIP